MANTTWDAWDDDVLSEVPGSLAGFVRFHVKLAAIDFCKRSWVWLVDQGPTPIVAGTAIYPWGAPVALPANTAVARVLQAWNDGITLLPKTRNELSNLYGDYKAATGPVIYFIQDLPSKLILVPNPTSASATTGITAKVAITPLRAATGLDSEIFDRYFDSIAKGAKARLLVMGKKPWTDVPRGQALQAEFEDAIASAKTDVIRSYASTRLRVRANFF